MPLDGNGNFYPSFPGMPPFLDADGDLFHGAGVPSNALGEDGDVYVDDSTGDVYAKAGGAWSIIQGAAGGSGESGVGSPEGVVSAPPGTTYVATDSNSFYVKTSGVGNTGWVALIT